MIVAVMHKLQELCYICVNCDQKLA